MRSLRRHLAACLVLSVALALGCRGTPPAPPPPAASPAPTTSAVAAPVAAPAPVVAPKSTVERLIELARTDSRVEEHARHLCLEIGPRLTGSSNLQAACEWSRDAFASFGLEARLERWGEFAVGFERGPWTGGIVAPVEVDFEFHTMAWTPGTDGPKRGPALAFPATEEELAALEPKLAGAWLVRPPPAELNDPAGVRIFAKPAQPSNELIRKVQERMVAQGALGEVRGSRGALLVTGGSHDVKWEELPKLVQVRVRRDQHDGLWTRMVNGEAVELEFDVQNRFVEGPIAQFNVVADLVGSELPDELVIVGGHLDSWDGAQGAVDNATGCATALEAARLLTAVGARPRRTIRFMLWTGEEQGLYGSRAYVDQHPELLPRISVVLNHDEGTNWLAGLGVTPAMLPAMRTACAPLFGLDPEFPFELSEVEHLPSFVGSDNDSFTRAGVPGLFWRQSGRSDYEHYHHTQHDNFDAIIPEYQAHSALVTALAALGVADLPELLDRTDMKAPEPRRLGVQLDGTRISELSEDSRAAAAGMRVGDVLLSIDGRELRNRGSVSEALREGGTQKTIQVKRGEETLTFTLDWSDDPDEPRRLQELEKRAAEDARRRAEREAEPAGAGAAPR